MNKKVDTFIVGAPKSGTTALANYLDQLDDCYVPSMKEPHIFCTDWPEFRRIKDLTHYHSLYPNVNEGRLVDASVWYLYSKYAAKNIEKYNKDAKILIMLRNPTNAVQSLYSQLVYSGREDAGRFEIAWNLEPRRRNGKCLPKNCIVPEHLFYQKVYDYPNQIIRYIKCFGESQCKIIIYEEFFSDIENKIIDVLKFLDLDSDTTSMKFDRINENRVHKYPGFSRFMMHPPGILGVVKGWVKSLSIVRGRPLLRSFYDRLSVKIRREPINDKLMSELEVKFAESKRKCTHLLNRSEPIW